jgi:hypothetical protein
MSHVHSQMGQSLNVKRIMPPRPHSALIYFYLSVFAPKLGSLTLFIAISTADLQLSVRSCQKSQKIYCFWLL